jgi:hypothetical protein
VEINYITSMYFFHYTKRVYSVFNLSATALNEIHMRYASYIIRNKIIQNPEKTFGLILNLSDFIFAYDLVELLFKN